VNPFLPSPLNLPAPAVFLAGIFPVIRRVTGIFPGFPQDFNPTFRNVL
jgi:hypothetical protein